MKDICETGSRDGNFTDDEKSRVYLEYYGKVNGYVRGKIADMMRMSYVNAKVIHAKALAHLREHMNI